VKTHHLVIIDDEESIRQGLSLSLSERFRVSPFPTAEEALETLARDPADLVLLDVGLPGMSGIEALSEITRLDPAPPVIMITAYEDIHTVVSAMKKGAQDYVVKPIQLEALTASIDNALAANRLRKEVQELQERFLADECPCFVTHSDKLEEVMACVRQVAKSPDTPVLITGETGTGKELVARAIHSHSPHFRGPFVAVNCASLPRELMESELFGYEKGAFSGALPTGKQGLIEQAEGGTLFLDEVGDLPLEAQAKLLRFLESGEFYRVGGTRAARVRARVVSATNQDLEKLIREQRFRKDLFFRLGVIRISVPALSERPEDILPLAGFFLNRFAAKFGKEITGITPEAARALSSHPWEGNVRELKNVIERAVLMARGRELTSADLMFPPAPGHPVDRLPELSEPGLDLKGLLQEIEASYLRQALALSRGNESKAARLLHLNHHTFRYRVKKLLG